MGELAVLSNLHLLLIDIYLSDLIILHDPKKLLETEQQNLNNASDQDD